MPAMQISRYVHVMKEKLKAFAYAMSGVSGCALTAVMMVALVISYDPWPELKGVMPLLTGLMGGVVSGTWFLFPRMRQEAEEMRFAGWSVLILVGALAIVATLPVFWRDIAWLVGKMSFDMLSVPATWSVWCERHDRWLELTGLLCAVAAMGWSWWHHTGFDRAVLLSLSVALMFGIAGQVFPEVMSKFWLIIGGFFIALSWGGPIGQGANMVWRNILSLFAWRPKAKGPTSIEVPEKGAEISKL